MAMEVATPDVTLEEKAAATANPSAKLCTASPRTTIKARGGRAGEGMRMRMSLRSVDSKNFLKVG